MLFYTFHSQKKRKAMGGTAFIEMGFCRLPMGTPIEKIVETSDCWQNDSLYIKDESTFYREYSDIFDCGIYNNLKRGPVDIYGLNYYAESLIEPIMEKLWRNKPTDYETLAEWLVKSKKYNGFYILGL